MNNLKDFRLLEEYLLKEAYLFRANYQSSLHKTASIKDRLKEELEKEAFLKKYLYPMVKKFTRGSSRAGIPSVKTRPISLPATDAGSSTYARQVRNKLSSVPAGPELQRLIDPKRLSRERELNSVFGKAVPSNQDLSVALAFRPPASGLRQVTQKGINQQSINRLRGIRGQPVLMSPQEASEMLDRVILQSRQKTAQNAYRALGTNKYLSAIMQTPTSRRNLIWKGVEESRVPGVSRYAIPTRYGNISLESLNKMTPEQADRFADYRRTVDKALA